MRKLLFLSLLALMLAGFVYSQEKPKIIDTVLNEIRQEQGLTNGQKINADKVSSLKLEELGDSVMEATIGNTERHELMDKMIGGEGSQSLTAFHQRIGYNYLAGYPLGMMEVTGCPFFGNLNSGGYNMMNGYGYGPGMMGWAGFGWGGMFMGLIFLVLIVLAVLFIAGMLRGGSIIGRSASETPLDILKKRYAKGEISKEEYEKMRKDLLS